MVYEAELHDTLTRLPRARYARIVNIGCAEGSYAIGLAIQNPSVVVYAFDLLLGEGQLCGHMAQANGVSDRVKIAEQCTVEVLNSLASDRTLIDVTAKAAN